MNWMRWLPFGNKTKNVENVDEQHPLPMKVYGNGADTPFVVTTAVRLPGYLSAEFLQGASVSDSIEMPDGFRIDELFFDTGWVGKISFQSSPDDGDTWYDQLEGGVSIEETPVPESSVPLTSDMSLRVSKKLVRFQSGIKGDLVVQASAQTVLISLISM